MKKLFVLFFLFTACGKETPYLSQRNTATTTTRTAKSKAILFDGVDEFLSTPDHTDFNFGTLMSAFLWVKSSSSSLSGGENLFSHSDNAGNQRGFEIRVATDTSKYEVYLSSDGQNSASSRKIYVSSVTVFDNSWHLIGFTWNNGSLKLYIDGVEDTAVSKPSDANITTIHDSTSSLNIGSKQAGGAGTLFFAGQLDEPALWSSELTSGQIFSIYNSGTPVDLKTHSASGSLVSWWRLGDDSSDDIGTINTIVDVQSSHDATPTNMEISDIVDRTLP